MTLSGGESATRVLVVRHGQSTWNAEGRWQGHGDPPLSDLGRAQARAAAPSVGPVDAVVSSDLRRAHETATLLAGVLRLGPVVVDRRLRERSAGEWEGMTKVEIEAAWPGYLDERRRPPGFEPDESVRERVHAAFDDLHRAHLGARLLVVSHGGVVRIVERHGGLDQGPVPNLGALEVTLEGGEPAIGARRALLPSEESLSGEQPL